MTNSSVMRDKLFVLLLFWIDSLVVVDLTDDVSLTWSPFLWEVFLWDRSPFHLHYSVVSVDLQFSEWPRPKLYRRLHSFLTKPERWKVESVRTENDKVNEMFLRFFQFVVICCLVWVRRLEFDFESVLAATFRRESRIPIELCSSFVFLEERDLSICFAHLNWSFSIWNKSWAIEFDRTIRNSLIRWAQWGKFFYRSNSTNSFQRLEYFRSNFGSTYFCQYEFLLFSFCSAKISWRNIFQEILYRAETKFYRSFDLFLLFLLGFFSLLDFLLGRGDGDLDGVRFFFDVCLVRRVSFDLNEFSRADDRFFLERDRETDEELELDDDRFRFELLFFRDFRSFFEDFSRSSELILSDFRFADFLRIFERFFRSSFDDEDFELDDDDEDRFERLFFSNFLKIFLYKKLFKKKFFLLFRFFFRAFGKIFFSIFLRKRFVRRFFFGFWWRFLFSCLKIF